MATLFAQNPITLRNPFSVLESHFDLEDGCTTATAPASNTADTDLDLSTWSVVNSPSASDDEADEDDDDDNDNDEIYHWQLSSSSSNSSTANLPIESGDGVDVQKLEPLRLSTMRDGFTNISKAMTARSINSASASCPQHRGAWVLKVNKRQRRSNSQEPQSRTTTAETETSTDIAAWTTTETTATATISTQTHDKRRLSPTIRVVHVVETNDCDERQQLYMDMTEHELSKSPRACRIKNNRVAIAHERELAKDLRCFCDETDKVDKKLLRATRPVRSAGSRKSNSSSSSKKAFLDEL
ncbi:hypothetical protein BGX29_009640 [Mortierella sp. GBA35]|nr:hypothetical protein BGX29_009640 [Mortierella sp. GBA35]